MLVDGYSESDEASKNHRITIIDIEVDSVGGYPRFEDPVKKITAIALWDSHTSLYRCFILDEEGVVENSTEGDRVILSYRSEEELLLGFLDTWEEICPTSVTGWNVNEPAMKQIGFDFP